MTKKCVVFLLVLILCLQLGSLDALAANDAGSPKHIPRVVSIVFDDSGSMYKDTDRWAYTSYAMQSFAAMMGSEDVLYITYLNAPAGTVKVDLSDGAKHNTVSGFHDIMFGGSTPDKVQNGADCLIKEFANYKDSAKYYLVVMADGELDSGLGELSDKVRAVSAATEAKLSGADFETIYFSMKSGDNGISGINSYCAANSNEIVSALKEVSADIMGRTEVAHTVTGGNLSFTLQYPALSIAVFVQKENGNFDSFRASVKKDGASLSCQVGNYNVKCPTQIIKNYNSAVYNERVPTNPPAGVVSLITNGGNSLPKGSYTIDVSGYGLDSDDIVVLVEPAVRIGCKYILNDDDDTITFEELKKRVCEGDTVTVICGLYELNADGSLGDPVPLDVLSPEYKILVNGEQVGSESSDTQSAYQFQVEKRFENQELRVEAILEGYQPFVLKETFGQLNIPIRPVTPPEGSAQVNLTKPLWKDWAEGEDGIRFEMEEMDASVLDRTAIEVDGVDGLPEGICSGLDTFVRVEGNTIVYLPKAENGFATLPDSFTVSLKDLSTGEVLLKMTVKVIQPTYRFETENALEGVSLSLEQLKTNSAAVIFTLTVDYDGSGQYIPVSQSDCEETVEITLSAGDLPGTESKDAGAIRFVPQYDPAVDADVSLSQLLGKDHSLFAAAVVDGKEVKSEAVTLSVSSAAYRLEVENQITQPLSLDTIKNNQQKIIFRLLADYDGSGLFGQLADWDTAALDKLTITVGDLPGKTETVYDAGGKPVGKAFIPQYDENNNNGIPFTVVAGKTHQITGAVAGTELTASTTVEVLAPDYDIVVRKDGITVTDVHLRGNTEGVEFVVLRDGRALTVQEMEGLAPYTLAFDESQPWVKIAPEVKTAEDGTVYLLCVPQYGGWRFPATWCWNWLCLFTVAKGDMYMTLTLGEDVGAAAVTVETSTISWIIFLIILAVLLVALWIYFCYVTRVRFLKGTFYVASFGPKPKTRDYKVNSVTRINASKKSFLRFVANKLNMLVPFSEQRMSISVEKLSAAFFAKKDPTATFGLWSLPYSDTDKNKNKFNKGHLSKSQIASILNDDRDFDLDATKLRGSPLKESDSKLDMGVFLVEKNTERIVFFVSKKEEKYIREKKKRSRGTSGTTTHTATRKKTGIGIRKRK